MASCPPRGLGGGLEAAVTWLSREGGAHPSVTLPGSLWATQKVGIK